MRGGGFAARAAAAEFALSRCGGDCAVGAAPRQGLRCGGFAAETVFIPAARVEQCRGTMPWNNAVEQCRAHQGRFHSPRCFSDVRVRRKGSGAHGNEPGRQNWDPETGRHEVGRPCLVRTAPNLGHRNWTAWAGGRQRNFSGHAWRTMGTWNQPQIVSDSGLGISGCSRTGIHASSF